MKNKLLIVLIAVIAVLAVGVGALAFNLANADKNTESVDVADSATPTYGAVADIGVEAGIVTSDGIIRASDDLNNAIAFTTNYQRDIYVTNGHDATCYIGNHEDNYYNNMYIQIYLNNDDDTLGEEIYLSKIIPRGAHIESFTLEKDLEPGDYRATLVHACLTDEGELVNNTPVIVEIHVSN